MIGGLEQLGRFLGEDRGDLRIEVGIVLDRFFDLRLRRGRLNRGRRGRSQLPKQSLPQAAQHRVLQPSQ